MGKLMIMCGAPGSGKSTWVDKLINEGDIWISRDVIRFSMLEEGMDYFAVENRVFGEFVKQINQALKMTDGYVFADATHLNASSRAKLLDRIRNAEVIGACCIETSLKDCLRQNQLREGRSVVPEDAIRNMHAKYSRPIPEEGISACFVVKNNKMKRVY